MGSIKEVLYKEVSDCTLEDATAYFYYHNLIPLHERFQEEYAAYEENQIHIRNKVIGDAIEKKEILKHPKIGTTIFGVSSLKQKPVVVVEI